ncbi:MAG: RnfH family protein [Magnetococcales bacterium]|nr:RnfH family protein [Magnetococcales bacterium]
MKIAVAYAEASKQVVLNVDLNEGETVLDAVNKSGMLNKFPNINLESCKLGIWGKIVEADRVLTEGERVEIYRPALGKPVKKSRPAKAPAVANKESVASDPSKADKMAAIKAKVAAAKAKKAGTTTAESEPVAVVSGSEAEEKAAKIAAIKAKVAAAKARKAAASQS